MRTRLPFLISHPISHAELEVVALVVDRPGAIGLHQNAVIGGGNQLFERQRLLAGQEC